MLYTKAVEPNTLSLLRRLQKIPRLDSFALVGGTALALRYGHRITINIDLFGQKLDKERVIEALEETFEETFVYEETKNKWAIFCFINDIKVDIIQYDQLYIKPIEVEDDIRMMSVQDISAMKINAILGRASKKDFWDLYELLHHFNLEEIIAFHSKKFPQQILLISIAQAISYFDDADDSEEPISLKDQSWSDIKLYIQRTVSEYLK